MNTGWSSWDTRFKIRSSQINFRYRVSHISCLLFKNNRLFKNHSFKCKKTTRKRTHKSVLLLIINDGKTERCHENIILCAYTWIKVSSIKRYYLTLNLSQFIFNSFWIRFFICISFWGAFSSISCNFSNSNWALVNVYVLF